MTGIKKAYCPFRPVEAANWEVLVSIEVSQGEYNGPSGLAGFMTITSRNIDCGATAVEASLVTFD
jgi:uncharacterized RmlC-like cupin family protein